MKKTTISRIPAFTAAGMAGVLTLTGCSGSSEGYDFTGPLEVEQAPESIEFAIPRELAEVHEGYAEDRILDSVVLTAVDDPEDPTGCAVQYSFDYADDAAERLYAYFEERNADEDYSSTPVESLADYLTGRSLEDIEFDEESYETAVVPIDCASSPDDDGGSVTRRVQLSWFDEGEPEYLARAQVSVMKGAGQEYELYIHEPEVRGWQVDSNGNWIKD